MPGCFGVRVRRAPRSGSRPVMRASFSLSVVERTQLPALVQIQRQRAGGESNPGPASEFQALACGCAAFRSRGRCHDLCNIRMKWGRVATYLFWRALVDTKDSPWLVIGPPAFHHNCPVLVRASCLFDPLKLRNLCNLLRDRAQVCQPPRDPSTRTMNLEIARRQMIEQQVRAWEVLDERVLGALAQVRRELFVPDELSRARVR